MNSTLITIFVLMANLSFSPAFLLVGEQSTFLSPDKELEALVIPIIHESRIEIRTSRGELLLRKDFDSPDGEHGYQVMYAAWTPDSEFFVFSTTSSGGHQPWRFPTYFYCRRSGKVNCLDDYLGSITEPNFRVTGPDLISVRALGIKTYQQSDSDIVEVSLRVFCN